VTTYIDPYDDGASDSLEELDAERIAADPQLPILMAAARERRAFLRELAGERKTLRISQIAVARAMGTSQAFISRLETGKLDPQHSTEDRYAAAIGKRVVRQLVDA
jgi:predicted transcriptional regulator